MECYALVNKVVVFGHRLDSMTSEVLFNLIASVMPLVLQLLNQKYSTAALVIKKTPKNTTTTNHLRLHTWARHEARPARGLGDHPPLPGAVPKGNDTRI